MNHDWQYKYYFKSLEKQDHRQNAIWPKKMMLQLTKEKNFPSMMGDFFGVFFY